MGFEVARRFKVAHILTAGSLLCFVAYFTMTSLSSSHPVRIGGGPIVMELVEPKSGTILSGTVPFRIKIVSGDPRIINRVELEFTQDSAVKIGPLEMWHIHSAPPSAEDFWYVSADLSNVPAGRYVVRISACDSEGKTAGELGLDVEVSQGASAYAYREWLGWLGGALAVVAAVAYWRRI